MWYIEEVSKSAVIEMTGKTPFQHFIKLLFLWGFLHFCWNEQVGMHDLFFNELWWIFLSTLKWAASSGHQKTVSSPSPYAYGNKPSDTHIRKQDNWKKYTHCVCVCDCVCMCVRARMCNNSELPTAPMMSLKSQVLYWI